MTASRWLVMVLVGAACMPPASAPSASSPPLARATDPTETPIRGGSVVWLAAEPKHVQPAIAGPRSPVNASVYEALAGVDPDTGEIIDGFGKVSQSSDGKTYHVRIDPRALWSDGIPITADDWLVTLKAIARLETKGDWVSDLRDMNRIVGFETYAAGQVDQIAGIRAEGERLTVTFEGVFCSARQLFALIPPLPGHVFGKYVAPGGGGIESAPENAAPPVASGPFRLREWRKGDHMEFERNDRYWRGAPRLDGYTVKFIPTTAEKQLEHLKSSIDVMGPIDAKILDEVEDLPGYLVHRVTPLSVGHQIFWNTDSAREPALRDARVRRALAHLLDWDMLASRLAPVARRVSTYIPTFSWASTGQTPIAHDPAAADELLRSAGYVRAAGGSYVRDGRPIALQLVTNRGNRVREAIAQFAADSLTSAGVSTTATVESFADVVGRALRGDYDAVILDFTLMPDPDVRVAWHSASIPNTEETIGSGNLNLSRLADRQIDVALDRAGSPADGDCSAGTRKKHYEMAARILVDVQPSSLGMALDALVVVPKRLRSYRLGPYNYGFRFHEMHLWWLAPETK